MLLQKNTQSAKLFLLLTIAFVFFHVVFFNYNAAEWGDSYRILRASRFIKSGEYPLDEKRPPLFASVLALQPASVDTIVFARGVMFLFSFGCWVLFSLLLFHFFPSWFSRVVGSLLFMLNPVFFYWSLRVMSDVPFAFFVLFSFSLFYLTRHTRTVISVFFLGILAGLSVLTRFEGYILFVSLLGGLVLEDFLELKNLRTYITTVFKSRALKIAVYVFGFSMLVLPYLIVRNPFSSSYLQEPASRAYDVTTLWVFFVALFTSLGAVSFAPLIVYSSKNLAKFFQKNVALTLFVVFEILLALAWPAAIPRLFVPAVPLFIFVFVYSLENLESLTFSMKTKLGFTALNLFFAVICFGSQLLLKLQFGILVKPVFLFVLFLQVLLIILIPAKRKVLFLIVLFANLLLWTTATLWIHKDVFISVSHAAKYAMINLKGNIGYNDVSSVSDWYINIDSPSPERRGFYYVAESKRNLELDSLVSHKIDYLVVTNEHNLDLTIDLTSRPYLQEIVEFRYNVNGGEFFTKIIKVAK